MHQTGAGDVEKTGLLLLHQMEKKKNSKREWCKKEQNVTRHSDIGQNKGNHSLLHPDRITKYS